MKADLKERCYAFSVAAVRFVSALPDDRVTRVLSDQLLRASTSIGANVVEAKAASSRRDFVKFYEIALKSANETAYWLRLVRDCFGSSGTEESSLMAENDELCRIIAASLITLKGKR